MTQTDIRRILWVDDEIDLLRPHIIFLSERHYEVIPVSNGDDAIELCRRGTFDLLLLDEMIPGRDGLSTLSAIADIRPNLPVVMNTKNEEEQLMDEAIGDRETSTGLRYKFGNQIDCDRRHAMIIEDPDAYRLPRYTKRTNYIIAREDYYFVYPNRFQEYRQQYKDSFQHGGISMEEMIMPILTLRPRHAGIS